MYKRQLVSRLKDGTSVKMAEKHILPRIQKIITELNEEGMEAILMPVSYTHLDVYKRQLSGPGASVSRIAAPRKDK